MNSHVDGNQEGTSFKTLYPAIKGYWGLLNNIPETPPNWMHASSPDEIERQLRKVRQGHKVPIGNRLAKYLAKWAVYRKPKGMSAWTDDWNVGFFKSAIAGRLPQFVQWAIEHPSKYSDLAVAGIRMVYDFQWPHNATAGYVFYALWGWLQIELHKPGESRPDTIAEQVAVIKAQAEKRGEKIVEWSSLAGGGIMAMTEPKDNVEQLPARTATISQPSTSPSNSDSTIEYFEVNCSGTLSAADFVEPTTRADIYIDIADSWSGSPDDLAEAMKECPPLEWLIQRIYATVREEIESELKGLRKSDTSYQQKLKDLKTRLKTLPAEPEAGPLDWLSNMTMCEFEQQIVPAVEEWFADQPDWGWEEDYFPIAVTSEDVAYKFFRRMSVGDLKTLGIVIVEGDRPGSTYYAAELRGGIKAANRSAEAAGIPVRFRKARRRAKAT